MHCVDTTSSILPPAALETVQLAASAKSISSQQAQKVYNTSGQVVGDSNRLQQIFRNLLSNAVKFSPTGGSVLQMEDDGDRAKIQVSDTGKGIEPEFLPFVFDYFRQADSTTTRKFGGLGLGLAIVRHLVELHGRTVNAQSIGVGLGATITVILPVKSAAPLVNEVVSYKTLPNLDGIRVIVRLTAASCRVYFARIWRICAYFYLSVWGARGFY